MRIASFLLAGCLALAGPVHASSDAKVLTFGIVPQQSASRLAQMWGPLLSALSDRSGYSVQFRTTKDIPTFEACLAAGAFDIAYMNPMHYAVFSQDGGYTAILRQANKRLKGLLVTRVDGARSLDDLDGETLAFPSPGAFGASVLTRAQLAESGVSFEPAYVKSHDSVYRAVAAGLMAGGGGVLRTFNAVDPEIRAQLQIIHETDAFTPHAIAVQAQIPEETRSLLQDLLLQIAASDGDLVQNIGMKGFQASNDPDWDDVRALNMAPTDTGILTDKDVSCPSV